MKVCILTSSFPAYFGDTQSPFIYRFAKGLVDKKLDVEVVCPFYKRSKYNNEVFEGIKIRRFTYFFGRLQTFTEVGGIPEAIKSFYGKFQLPFFCFSFFLKSLQIGKKSDLIHAQWLLPSGFMGLILKKVYRKPLVVTTRGSEVLLASRSSFWKFIFKSVAMRCDCITSNNKKHLEIFKSFGINSDKLLYIPNGLDYALFKKRDKMKIRKKLRLNLNDKIVLFVGNLLNVKRCDILIKSFNYLADKNKKIKLLIVGDGALRYDLINLVKRLNLNSNITFIGSIDPASVYQYFNAADVFVLSSESEGRPNVVLEAMASGLPVVTTDVGDIRSFIKDGRDGFIVKINDINMLTNKLNKLLSSNELRARFSLNGLKAVRKANPSWEEAALGYIKLYDSLLKNG